MILLGKSHDIFSEKSRYFFQNLTHQYAWGLPQLVLKKKRRKRKLAPTRKKKNDILTSSKYQQKKSYLWWLPTRDQMASTRTQRCRGRPVVQVGCASWFLILYIYLFGECRNMTSYDITEIKVIYSKRENSKSIKK